MIFISGIVSITIQKNTLCTNKTCVIYFCPNCVNVLPKKPHNFIVGWKTAHPLSNTPPHPTPPPAPPSSCVFLYMMSFPKQLIAADRNGDWETHLQTGQSILPIFSELNSINYLRHGSVYLKQMRRLP